MFQLKAPIGRLLTILVCSSVLVGCGSTKNLLKPTSLSDRIPVTESQFDCGPKAPNLPPDEILKTWSSDKTLDWGGESWLWGERCSITNEYNKAYFMCKINKDKAACDRIKKLKEEVDKANGASNK